MEELKPILIKPMVKKYYDKLKTNEQRLEFWENLVFRGMDGQEPQIEDEMVELALMPCLDSIRECRENYNRRQAKNAEYGILGKEYGAQGKEYGIQGKEYGAQGKEYGIQGKEFGKLGGRPRKGETKEEYNERKRLENESLISEKMGEDSQWTKMFNEIKQDKELIRQIKDTTLPKEVMNDFAKRYGAETASAVLDWVLNKYIIN